MNEYNVAQAENAKAGIEQQTNVLGKVLSLVGFGFAFTAAGALVGPMLEPEWVVLSVIGAFLTLFALIALKETSPINLGLMYTFCTLEGIVLGEFLSPLIAAGHGNVVIQAAAATMAVTIGAGIYGIKTKRDLTGFGDMLFIGLLGLIAVSVVGIFLQSSMLSLAISVVGVALFTGFIVYDMNKAVNLERATEGAIILLAVNIYLDILNLFLYLLQIFGGDD